MRKLLPLCALYSCLTGLAAVAADRDVQIRSVNFETSVVELHNFGTNAVSIEDWRFLTYDDDQTFQQGAQVAAYTIGSGESYYVHFLNDAPAVSNRINISTIGGGFATPLDRGPYALSVHTGAPFDNTNNIVDFVQWNVDGAHAVSTADKSYVATNALLWTSTNDWVHTTAFSRLIELSDYTGGELHDYMDYTTVEDDCLFWFRFNEGGGTNYYDSAARFSPALAWTSETRDWQLPWSDPIYDADHDIANPYAFSGPLSLLPAALEHAPLPISSDWTAEVIHQFNPGGTYTAFFDLDEGNGVSTTNSTINFRWIESLGTGQVEVVIRDRELQDSSAAIVDVADLPADGKWHHVAAVKEGSILYGYLDYQLVASNGISFRGDGTYEFTTNHNLAVGVTLNNANSSKDVNIFDEVRLTMAALDFTEFMRPGQPIITNMTANTGIFTMKYLAISGLVYEVQKTSDILDDTSWFGGTIFTSTVNYGSHGSSISAFTSNQAIRVRRIFD